MRRIKDRIEVERTKATVRRWLAWLLCIAVLCSAVNLVRPALASQGDDTLPTISAVNEEDNSILLASFTFEEDEEDEEIAGRLTDKSRNGVKATLVGANIEGYNIIGTLGGNDFVDSFIGTVSGNNSVDNVIGTVSGNNSVDNLIGTVSGNNYVDSTISTYSENGEYDIMGIDIGSDNLEEFFGKGDDNNTYLDLSGEKNVYLSLTNKDGSGVLADMVEVTVEMRVRTQGSDENQWIFYAAPDDSWPGMYTNDEHYLSVHIDNNNAAFARRYNGTRPNTGLSTALGRGDWYTVKVVYEADQTTLSVKKDGEEEVVVSDTALSADVWKCVENNSVLWFGYSGFGGTQYFNGYIDDIKIYGTPGYITEDVENNQIITGTDPANTVVNMFDYWVFDGQTDRDYALGYDKGVDDLVNENSKINYGHLFLFDGSESFVGGGAPELGLWNQYGGTGFKTSQSKWGIVKNNLNEGYPQLALDADTWGEPLNGTLKNLWNYEKRTESLAYLFDPDMDNDGKASYPNVTGLFQIDKDGYYYFRSQEVFAELNKEQGYDPNEPKAKESKPDANKITLYNTPWMEVDSNGSRGQFFPFNDWTDLFYEFNGNLVQRGDQGYQADHQPMNHWFGMTIQTKFMQPTDGMLNPDTPMTFEFSGDDDVWIFIDDVLVADVGGVHQRIRVTIDYATGKIEYLGSLASDGINPSNKEAPEYFGYLGEGTETTLRKMFEEALGEAETNKLQWNKDKPATFADGTMHTLKFFYLERGNAASNCNIRFNLQEPIAERIRKVDQNGDPLEGATFELYKATVRDGININDGDGWHTASDFKIDGGLITTATIKSDKDGYASLTTADGDPLDLTQSTYYILEEKGTPVGYRKNPPIVLQYHEGSNTHTVVNKYETGAYASFLAEWIGSEDVYFAKYSDGNFSKDEGTGEIDESELEAGLAIVVPVVKSWDTPDGTLIWRPMYGSNTYGWNIVVPDSNNENDLITALAEAAIVQITDSITQDWYLSWDGERLNGYMENLPGDATRYVFNGGSDGDLVTLFLPKNALEILLGSGDTYDNADDRYMALRKALEGKDAKTLAEGLSGLKILYTENFIKNNRTVIYVSNEQRELRVRKVDEDGNPMDGAVFALFDTPENAAAGNATTSAGVEAYGETDENGELIFRANVPAGSGYAKMEWDSGTAVYWLKEITAPEGYALNKSLIRVEVGSDGIYANATGFGFDSKGNLIAADNDGISVEASLGRLNQTMVKYAEGIVDETLKYITFTKQTARAVGTWGDAAKSEKRTYVTNGNGYGSVNFDDFTVDDGYIRVMPRQQTEGLPAPTAKRDILTDTGEEGGNPINLDGLFSLINTVVVTDMPVGNLTVKKTVEVPEGVEFDADAVFTFTVTLSGEGAGDINGTYGDMTFKDGVATITLNPDKSKTAVGLPAGIKYTVEESDKEGYTLTKRTGYEGTITQGATATAEFTNRKDQTTPPSSPDPSPTPSAPGPDPSPTPSAPGPDPSPTPSAPGPDPSPTPPATNPPTLKPPMPRPSAKGGLTVSNTVRGNAADESKDFTYTVTLDDDTINGTYGDMEFVNGVATFTLKHGESKKAEGLPAGIKYTVTESDYDDYGVNSIIFSGTIPENRIAEEAYINIRNVSVGQDNIPKTGDNSHPGLWLAMLVLSLVVMGMSFRTLRRKRFLHEEEKHLK